MKYLSVCSGIEAATCAWHSLGWKPFAFSEIEPFPSAVLDHHYPLVPNLGDMTKFKEWPDATIDVLVGGTPCQSFSLAGLRKGLDDPRGNLMLTYLAIAARYRPEWLVWENVPGVLSSNGGKDFGTFLGGLGECGYGFAYRILDAQYFGVAQRRRRVFVVGHLGDWRRAAAVLFERHSLSGHPAPRREAGKDVAPTVRSGAANGGAGHGARSGDSKDELIVPIDTAHSLRAQAQASHRADSETYIPVAKQWPADVAPALDTTMKKYMGLDNQHKNGAGGWFVPAHDGVAHSLRGEAFDASEDGTGRGTPIIPIAFPSRLSGTQHASAQFEGPHDTAAIRAASGGSSRSYVAGMQVRRLTPVECERLQGFSDGYTDIKPKGKPTADGTRYKAQGNSMTVPVMAWIGQRIEAVQQATKAIAEAA